MEAALRTEVHRQLLRKELADPSVNELLGSLGSISIAPRLTPRNKLHQRCHPKANVIVEFAKSNILALLPPQNGKIMVVRP